MTKTQITFSDDETDFVDFDDYQEAVLDEMWRAGQR